MAASCGHKSIHGRIDGRVDDLLSQMTLQEKIGQLNQLSLMDGFSEDVVEQIEAGMVGSILNEADPEIIDIYQKAAVEKSRLGIPTFPKLQIRSATLTMNSSMKQGTT